MLQILKYYLEPIELTTWREKLINIRNKHMKFCLSITGFISDDSIVISDSRESSRLDKINSSFRKDTESPVHVPLTMENGKSEPLLAEWFKGLSPQS